MPDSEIGFAQLGLASILKQNQLMIPPNQREYSWTTREVRTLLQDFTKAISQSEKNSYFLGTIVTIPRGNGILEVVDGQQRLATITIILSAIRDYLQLGDPIIAESIESEFLTVIDRTTRARIPRLRLNLDDNDYFRARLTNTDPTPLPTRTSHRLIDDAFVETKTHIENIVAGFDEKDRGDFLNNWISFMESRALAVLLRVPNDSDAYRMFETLNDRGLRTSQSDLVKNYLFGKAGDRLQEIQQKWAYMRGALETIEDDDITIMFLRHALTVIYGFVREAQVYESVQENARASQPVVAFANQLETLAHTYIAIQNKESEKWNKYPELARRGLEVLNLFDLKPMRPLLLAAAHKMTEREASKVFQFCVSLCVRLMVTSGTRTGTVEQGLATAARGVFAGTIGEVEALKSAIKDITPDDERFRLGFDVAQVSTGKLARYYLRSLEMAAKKESEPWHIPNDDRSVINLEHVLPEKTEGNWPQFTEEQVKLYYKRIGNMALLKASDNSDLKSSPFGAKKTVYAACPYILTRQIADVSDWTMARIEQRQKTLSQLAIKAWPI